MIILWVLFFCVLGWVVYSMVKVARYRDVEHLPPH
jgi:hypothetical protein